MLAVKSFFGYKSMTEFKADWLNLTEQDREQIKAGIADGTFTY